MTTEHVTIEGHDVPPGAVKHRVGEVIGPAIARTAKYPSDTGDQMPPFACGGSDNEPECSSEGSKTFPPQAMTCGQLKTRSTGYSANCSAEVSEDASLPGAIETSFTELET